LQPVSNSSNRFNRNDNNKKDLTKTNEDIRAKEVRLIDENGEMLGVMSSSEALNLAISKGLDLVEINPESKPPVCKIMDYGKFKYLAQKKKQEAKKKQKVTLLKELYVHLGIGIHDFNVKLKQIKLYISEEDKVKVAVKFRGREIDYAPKGLELLHKFYNECGGEQFAKFDTSPKIEGNNAVMILAPLTKNP
jgi:translation initiation factor IF-3